MHRLPYFLPLMIVALFAGLFAGRPVRAEEKPFVHPGVLHTRAELLFVKTKIAASEAPWASAWARLRDKPISKLEWEPKPAAEVVRGPYNRPDIGGTSLMRDGAAAYTHALQWVLTEKPEHARKAIEILDAYSSTLESVGGHDARLLVGMVGINYVNAAELLRHWKAGSSASSGGTEASESPTVAASGAVDWPEADQARFEQMLRQVFYQTIEDFYPSANGNWDASMIQTMLAMGVFLDDREMFNRAAEYYRDGKGNGAVTNYINDFGECQESGRDQAHTQMGLGYLACAAEIAWKQGVDLYRIGDNRLRTGFEYTAKYNLGHEVPYEPYRSFEGRYHYPKISEKARGRFSSIYERVYHHYHDRLGLEMPYTRQVLDKIRPEPFQLAHAPWGTLMFAEGLVEKD
ncbi:MAG: alginate lyase family protein [Planctomycetota bacterium]